MFLFQFKFTIISAFIFFKSLALNFSQLFFTSSCSFNYNNLHQNVNNLILITQGQSFSEISQPESALIGRTLKKTITYTYSSSIGGLFTPLILLLLFCVCVIYFLFCSKKYFPLLWYCSPFTDKLRYKPENYIRYDTIRYIRYTGQFQFSFVLFFQHFNKRYSCSLNMDLKCRLCFNLGLFTQKFNKCLGTLIRSHLFFSRAQG